MNPWLETVGVVIIAVLGVVLGRMFGRLKGHYWLCGYFLSLLLVVMLVVARWSVAQGFVPPLFWIATGRIKFVILALAVTMGLTTPLSRLPHKCEKYIISTLMVVVVVWFSILPFLAPALIKGYLSNLKTRVNSDGICFQSTDYTCGPAAAVTALRKLGLDAREGEIAVLSHTSPVAGTLAWSLYTALQNRYGPDGLKCQYQRFDSIAQLRDAGLTLAMVKDSFLLDHCVAVLEVSDRMVIFADPVLGKKSISHSQFEKVWRFSGIVLKRESTQSI